MSEKGSFEVSVLDRTKAGVQSALANLQKLIVKEQTAGRSTDALDKDLLKLNRQLRTVENQSRRASGELSDFAKTQQALGATASRAAGDLSSLNKAQKALGATARRLQTGFIALAGSMAVGKIVSMADAWTNANNRIKLFTTSAAEQLKIQRDLFAIAQKTRVGYGVTSQLYQRLTIANDRLNLSQADTARLTETINKAFTVSGASTDEAANAIRQLTQAFNKGKLDGDEYRSVAENAGNVLGIIAEKAGVAKGELQKMAEDGKITAELLASSFLDGADKIDAQFKRMDVSVESSFTILTNSLTRAVGQFDKATGASDALGRSIRFIGEAIDGVDWAAVGEFLSNSTNLTQSQIAAYDPRSRRAGGRGFDEPGGFGSSSGAFVGPLQSQGGSGPRDKTLEKSARAWANEVNKRFADAKFGEQFFKDFSDSVRQTRDAGSGRFRGGLGGGGGGGLPTLANLGLKLGRESEDISFGGRTYQDDVRDQGRAAFRKRRMLQGGAGALLGGNFGGAGGLAGGEIGDKIGAKLAEKLPGAFGSAAGVFGGPVGLALGQAAGPIMAKHLGAILKGTFKGFSKLLGGILKALSPFDTGSGIAGQEQGFGDRSALLQGLAVETLRLSLTEERQRLAILEQGSDEYENQRAIVEALELKFEELAGAQATVWEGQQGFAKWMAGQFTETWDTFALQAQDKWHEIQASGLSAEEKLKEFDTWVGSAFTQTWDTFKNSVNEKWQSIRAEGDLNLTQMDSMDAFIKEQLTTTFAEFEKKAVEGWKELAGAQATVWEGQQGFAEWMSGSFTQTWDTFSLQAQDKWREIQASGLSAEEKLNTFNAWIGNAFTQTWDTFKNSVNEKWQSIRDSGELNQAQMDTMDAFIKGQLGQTFNAFEQLVVGGWKSIFEGTGTAEDKTKEFNDYLGTVFTQTWADLLAGIQQATAAWSGFGAAGKASVAGVGAEVDALSIKLSALTAQLSALAAARAAAAYVNPQASRPDQGPVRPAPPNTQPYVNPQAGRPDQDPPGSLRPDQDPPPCVPIPPGSLRPDLDPPGSLRPDLDPPGSLRPDLDPPYVDPQASRPDQDRPTNPQASRPDQDRPTNPQASRPDQDRPTTSTPLLKPADRIRIGQRILKPADRIRIGQRILKPADRIRIGQRILKPADRIRIGQRILKPADRIRIGQRILKPAGRIRIGQRILKPADRIRGQLGPHRLTPNL